MTRSTRFSALHTRLNIIRGPTFIESITNGLTALESAPSDEEQRRLATGLRSILSESLERYHPQNSLHNLIFDIQIFLARYWPINKNDHGEIVDCISHEIITEAALDGDNVIPLSSGQLFHRQTLKRYYLSANSYIWVNGRKPKHPLSNRSALSERDEHELRSKNIFPPPQSERDGNQRRLDYNPELQIMFGGGTHLADIDEHSPYEKAGIIAGWFVGMAAHIAVFVFCSVVIPLWLILPISIAVGTINAWHNVNSNGLPSLLTFGYGFMMAYTGSITGTSLASIAVTSILAVLTTTVGAAAVASISAMFTAVLPFVPLVLLVSFSVAECFRRNAITNLFTATLLTPFSRSIIICRYLGKGLDKIFNFYRQHHNRRQPAHNAVERQPAAQVAINAAQIQQGLGIEQRVHHANGIPEAPENNLPEQDILFPWGHRTLGAQPIPVVRQISLGH